jgi:nicotinamidase-related amidase
MPRSRSSKADLHGNAPDDCQVALLVIDMINAFEFDGAERVFLRALEAAKAIAALKARAGDAGVPVIYVNDNFGKWRSDFRTLLEHCLKSKGRPIAELLRPQEDDYFVLKPKHSGFFSTTLDTLLDYLKARTLILTGVAANICVLFTANDAYMRDFNLVIPSDCVASNTAEDNEHALKLMEQVLKAETTPSDKLDLEELKRAAAREPEAKEPQAQTPQFAEKD